MRELTFLEYSWLPIEPRRRKCKKEGHLWNDRVDSWTEVTGDGHLVLVCKRCGYIKHLEGT